MRRPWLFFPVIGKKPALEGDWRLHSTDDVTQLEEWRSFGYGLALDCEKSGVLVVDIDPGSGKTPADYPATMTKRTPRGGWHLIYEGVGPTTVQKIAPHVDTRGNGGYIAYEGAGYSAPSGELAPLPVSVSEALAYSAQKTVATDVALDLPHNIARAIAWLQARPAVAEGAGCDAKTLQAANAMLDMGLSGDTALTVMLEHYRCWPQDERFEAFLTRKIENAEAYRQNDVGAWAVAAPLADRFSATLDQLGASIDQGGGNRPKSVFYPYDEAEQDAFEPPKMVLADFLPDNTLVMLYAQPGSYKSFLALDVGLTLAAGLPRWENTGGSSHEVVYIAGEGPRSIARLRRPAWRDYHGVDQSIPFHLVRRMPHCADRDQIDEFVASVKARGIHPKLVVVDTLARFMLGMNENDVKDAQIAVSALEIIRDQLNCAVLAVHHEGKGQGQDPRGSSALIGGFDTLHRMVAHKESKAVAVTNILQKDGEERPKPWLFQGKSVGKSLVFDVIDEATYKQLTAKRAEGVSVAAVIEVLQRVGRALGSQAMAAEMYRGPKDEDPTITMAKVSDLRAALDAAAKKDPALAPYTQGQGHSRVWKMPA